VTPGEKQQLTRIVERTKAINAQVQELKWEAKEIAESAWDKCGVKPKVVKQLAKEAAWDQVQREERRQFEESLDECRAALGLLADLPLGQAATASHANGRATGKANGHANGQAADGYDDHVRDTPAKRGRGRPKGSRNKSRQAPGTWSRPPRDDPPVPDVPDAA
jgi:hypothetical protein